MPLHLTNFCRIREFARCSSGFAAPLLVYAAKMFFWYYVWTEDAGWARIRQNAALEHLRGEIALPRCHDRFVRFGEISGRSENREPLDVSRVDFTRHPSDERGFMTRQQHDAVMRRAIEGLDDAIGLSRDEPLGPTVIDATREFARRRYDAEARWRPSKEALEEFCRLINKRARRALIAVR